MINTGTLSIIKFIKVILLFAITNLTVFFLYRLCFLKFLIAAPIISNLHLFLSGVRLDLALFGFELSSFILVLLLWKKIKLRYVLLALLAITFIHIIACAANFFVLKERNQQFGELLVEYITSPADIMLTIGSFLAENVLVVFCIVILAAVMMYAASIVYTRPFFKIDFAPRGSVKNAVTLVFILMLCGVCVVEPARINQRKRPIGWTIILIHPDNYNIQNNYFLNQAIHNPLFEFASVDIPHAFSLSPKQYLEHDTAVQLCSSLIGSNAENKNYPFLRKIISPLDLGIRNIIILQVEGLSEAWVEQKKDGRQVMPFLHNLKEQALFFPNTIQVVPNTSGGVFSTATSMLKEFLTQKIRRFSPSETNGYYGTLPRILGPTGYHHFYFQAFRQAEKQFRSFMANQGYEAFGYKYFVDRLDRKNKLKESNALLGIFDGPFLEECAEILKSQNGFFTTHIMTSTSHSPWKIPQSFPASFSSADANAFNYVDASIKKFFEIFGADPVKFNQTLFVIVDDHTSVGTKNVIEKIRIPLFFYAPALEAHGLCEKSTTYGSQKDILPTILALIGGEHRYSDMGQNLLRKGANNGIISGSSHSWFYIKNSYFLEYDPYQYVSTLFKIFDHQYDSADIAQEYPDLCEQMKHEGFAQIEAARFLKKEKRVFPFILY
jgi:phosphoglycerol transferase MdoB-like AlkP superfamily enzyme